MTGPVWYSPVMPRNEVIEFKVTAEEKERIRSQAKHLRVPVGEFVRSCALREHLGSPVPYETEREKTNKAKVRKAVENEEPYEVRVEPSSLEEADKRIEDDLAAKDAFLAKRIPELKSRMSSRNAEAQARREWEERNG